MIQASEALCMMSMDEIQVDHAGRGYCMTLNEVQMKMMDRKARGAKIEGSMSRSSG